MIWYALLIPIVIALLALYFFRKEIVWWELFLPIGASAVLIGVSSLLIESRTFVDEYWGGYTVTANYYEPWEEYVHRTCSHTTTIGKSSVTTYYDCSYYDFHPAYYCVIDNNGIETRIDESVFKRLTSQFGNNTYYNLNRRASADLTKDGNLYQTKWTGNWNTMEPVVSKHEYENKVRFSNSIFNKGEETDTANLIPYPHITGYYNCKSIVGANVDGIAHADSELTRWNATLGKTKRVRMLVFLFKNKGEEIAYRQERKMYGGNMNEFITMIGVDDSNNVNWCHVTSWTDNEHLKIEVRDSISNQKKLDLSAAVSFIGNSVNNEFVKKSFKRDFDYLKVEPPTWAIALVYILTLVLSCGITYWSITNDETND